MSSCGTCRGASERSAYVATAVSARCRQLQSLTAGLALAREGAYSKAVSTLRTELAQLDAGEQRRWAAQLPPSSTRFAEALSSDQDTVVAGSGESSERWRNVMRGVHFPAMSAPGPNGARPEHIRECVAVRRRPVANRLHRAIGALVNAAAHGRLPESSRWILGSRLVYLRKKRGNTPRLIRIGELWRRLVAKKLLHYSCTSESSQRPCCGQGRSRLLSSMWI